MICNSARIRLRNFWRRRHQQLKNHIIPFNLKEVSRSPRGHIRKVGTYPKMGWLGAWVGLGSTDTSRMLSRVYAYTFNNLKFWLVCPARIGLTAHQKVWLDSCLRGLTCLASLKLKFKGKSFRWHRRKQSLVLRFGHSHLVTCTPPTGVKWKKSGKTKMLFFSSNITLLREYLTSVVAWREPNRYHSRGLRLSKQYIMRKAGKVSAYR